MATTTEPGQDPAVRVRGLVKDYGSLRALGGVDLDVHRGEVVALLGPNGAGKTTLVEVLEGHRQRTAGVCHVLGLDPATSSTTLRDRLGIVPQSAGFEIQLTVEETLRQFAGYYSRPRSPDDVLDLVGLREKRSERVGRLSGGQMGRLDLGLALVGDPDLIFLDEPTTGFDPQARNRTWDLIQDLRSFGRTILLTTHNLDEAQRLADRVLVLVAGRVVAEGPPDRLLGERTPRAVVQLPKATGRRLPASLAHAADDDGDHLVLRTPDLTKTLAELTSWAVEDGVSLDGLTVSAPTLEDMYLQTLDGHARGDDRQEVPQ